MMPRALNCAIMPPMSQFQPEPFKRKNYTPSGKLRIGAPGMSAADAKRPHEQWAKRMCHNCKTYQRASGFKEVHRRVHMACSDCYHRAMFTVGVEELKAVRHYIRQYKNGAKARGYAYELTLHAFIAMWRKPCHYCQAPIEAIGIDRVDNARGYAADNCVPCCWPCNTNKGVRSVADWLK